MAWFKHDYGGDSYEGDRRHFAKLFIELGRPKGMMMVSTGEAVACTVHLALSKLLAIRNFPGFELCEEPPPESKFLFGDDHDFTAFQSNRRE